MYGARTRTRENEGKTFFSIIFRPTMQKHPLPTFGSSLPKLLRRAYTAFYETI